MSSGKADATLQGLGNGQAARAPQSGPLADTAVHVKSPQRKVTCEIVEEVPDTSPDLREEETPAKSLSHATTAPEIASVIGGRYYIESTIGEGGMARVWRARHNKLGRVFALKQMHESLSSDARLRKQFFSEARLASSLSHSNIVSVVDFGEDPKLGAFMVMEFLDGKPLADRVRGKGPMPLRMACDIVAQIADALHYIHSKKIVHCDVKPDNILLCEVVTQQRRRWSVKLLDFGLARPKATQQSASHTVNGTPAYMAPEQIFGETPTPSVDIYGLAILFYELVTGAPPFLGSSTEIMRAHVMQEPKRPSEVLGSEVDERLEALILKALSKSPDQRHCDMGAFIFELRTLIDMLGLGRRRARPSGSKRQARSQMASPAEQAFERSPMAMAVVKATGEIQAANRRFRKLVGASSDDRRSTSLEDGKLSKWCPSILADLKHCVTHDETKVLRFDVNRGGVSSVVVTIASLPDGDQSALVSVSVA